MSTILSKALFGKTQNAVLSLFFTNVDETYYLREVVRRTGMGHGAVQRELKKLADASIIVRQDRGRQSFYSANKDCPIYDELHNLAIKTAGVAELISTALQVLDDNIDSVFIYGSFADGTETSASDIDLFIIGDTTLRAVVGLLGELQLKLGREINPVVYTPAEYVRKIQAGSHFLNKLNGSSKIFIKGNLDDIGRLG